MTALWASWVEGSAALDVNQLPSCERRPHLSIVPSAPECEESEYGLVDNDVQKPKNYESFLMLTIKSLAVLIFLCCLALVGLGIGFAVNGGADNVVTVQSGDSLYSIGARVPDAPSPAQAVEDIRSLNALESDVLHAGQKLILPEY